MPIPIIDIFAGPGGLGEGFSSLIDKDENPKFKIALSIEKDPIAHETLRLRSFYRQFPKSKVPDEYYKYLRGEITDRELWNAWPKQAKDSETEAWCATLGEEPDEKVDERIKEALGDSVNWVL